MKRFSLVLMFLAVLGTFGFAQEAPAAEKTVEQKVADLEAKVAELEAKKSVMDNVTASGSVEFKIGSADAEDVPFNFSKEIKGNAAGKFAIKSADGKIEAGAELNLIPIIEITEGSDADDTSDDQANLDALEDMIDWWEYYTKDGNDLEGRLNNIVYANITDRTDEADVTTAILGLDLADLIVGGSLVDDDDVEDGETGVAALDSAKLLRRQQSIHQITVNFEKAVKAQIDAAYPTDTTKESWTDNDDLKDDFDTLAFGKDTDDKGKLVFPVKNAYLRFKEIGGYVDLGFEINGKKLGPNSLIPSAIAQTGSDLGVTLGVSKSVVDGFHFDVATTSTVAKHVSDDHDTYYNEEDRDYNKFAVGLDTGYTYDKKYGIDVRAGGFFDTVDPTRKNKDVEVFAGMTPMVNLPEAGNLKLKAEVAYRMDYDFGKVAADDAIAHGYAVGMDISANAGGVTPSVKVFWKNDSFGGDDSYEGPDDSEDAIDDASAVKAFNSIDDTSAMNVAFAIGWDLEPIIGMKLLSFKLGTAYTLDFADATDLGNHYLDWNAGFTVDLAKVWQPVSLAANFKMIDTLDDYTIDSGETTPDAEFQYDITIAWKATKNLTVSATQNRNDDGEYGYSAGVKATF